MNSLEDRVRDVARPVIESKGAYIIDVKISHNQSGQVVEVYVDIDTGVTAELCAAISRDLSQALDQTGLIAGRYHLVVSSPGIDRGLKHPRQYPRNIGRMLSVEFRNNNQLEKLLGKLVGATAVDLVLQLDDEAVRTISFTDVVEARVTAPW